MTYLIFEACIESGIGIYKNTAEEPRSAKLLVSVPRVHATNVYNCLVSMNGSIKDFVSV